MDLKQFILKNFNFNNLSITNKNKLLDELYNDNPHKDYEAIDIITKLASFNNNRPVSLSKNQINNESLAYNILKKRRFGKDIGNARKIMQDFRNEYKRIDIQPPLGFIDYWTETAKIDHVGILYDNNFLLNIQDYYDTLILKWNSFNHDNSKKIEFGSITLTVQYNDNQYFTVKEKLTPNLLLDKVSLIKQINLVLENYEGDNEISSITKMELSFFIDKKTTNTNLKAYGKTRHTKGAIFSPVLYNWFCCLSEIACFLKYRHHWLVNSKLYKFPKIIEWGYLNMFAIMGNLFNNDIKISILTGKIKDFIIAWNTYVKKCELVLFNSVTSEYFPYEPQTDTEFVLFWYPYHVELFNKNYTFIKKPKPFTFNTLIKKPSTQEEVICTLDIETYTKDITGEQIPYLICIHSKEYSYDIALTETNNIINEFISHLKILTKNKDKKYIFWAHNGMKFDYLFLLPALVKEFNVKPHGKINTLKILEFNNIKFLDFYKFFNSKLNTLAQTFLNESKLDFDFNLVYDKASALKIIPTALEYCQQDCKILYKLVINFNNLCIDKFNISINDCLSASHLAKTIFQTQYLKISIKGSIKTDYDIEKESYHGGMTMMFYKGKYPNKIYVYDINSSYPYSMLFDMPVHFIKQKECKSKQIIDHYLYLCTYKFPEYSRVCNLSTLYNGELIFVKEGSGWYWGCELILAKKLNAHISLQQVRKYKPLPIFKDYINDIYEKRKLSRANKEDVLSELYKKLLNSLYGKFGQKLRHKTYIERYNTFLENNTKINDLVFISKEAVYVEYTDNFNFYNQVGSLIRLSSYITARSRCSILEPIININHDHLLYMDTDSLFLTKQLPTHYLHPTELGKFKMETYEAGIFISSKNYMLYSLDPNKHIYHMKGVNIKNVSLQNYIDLINNNFTKVFTLQSITKWGQVFLVNKEKTVTCFSSKRNHINNYTYPHNTKEDFLIYKEKQLKSKSNIPKDIIPLSTPNQLIKESNLVKKQLNDPCNLPIILPHRDEYNKLKINDYLKHRMLLFCKTISKDEKAMLYKFLYNKNPTIDEIRIELAKYYGFHIPTKVKHHKNKSISYNLTKNGFCRNWKLTGLNNLKQIFVNLQYNHIKKTI